MTFQDLVNQLKENYSETQATDIVKDFLEIFGEISEKDFNNSFKGITSVEEYALELFDDIIGINVNSSLLVSVRNDLLNLRNYFDYDSFTQDIRNNFTYGVRSGALFEK